MFRRRNRSRRRPHADSILRDKEEASRTVFYVNVTILDASAAVYEKVREKVGNITALPFKKRVANKISGIVNDEAVTKRLARKLPKLLMYILGQKGLQLHAETVYVQETYLVLELKLLNADPVALAQSAAEDAATDRLKQSIIDECKESGVYDQNATDDSSISTQVLDDWLNQQNAHTGECQWRQYSVTSRLDAMSPPSLTRSSLLARIIQCILDLLLNAGHRSRLESEYLPNLIQTIVANKMDQVIRRKMEEKQVHAETVVLSEANQARYFFGQLRLTSTYHQRVKSA